VAIRETTELRSERATQAVQGFVEQLSYPGQMLVWSPIECGNIKGVWLVVVCWEKEDHRGNRFSQVIGYIVWGDEDGKVKMRPDIQEDRCVAVSIRSFNHFPDHDGKIHLQYDVQRAVCEEFEPPWQEEE